MKHRNTRELYNYWNRLRGPNPAPVRGAIEPSDIRGLLVDTFILDTTARWEYPFRLAGTRICTSFGRELKGRNFLDLWSGKDREAIAMLLAAVSADAAAAVVGVDGFNDRDGSVPLELLFLPLIQSSGRFDRVLGLISPMETPYWLGLHPIMRQSISSLRLIWPDEKPFFLRNTNPFSLTVPSIGERPSLLEGERRAHLIVLQGGRR